MIEIGLAHYLAIAAILFTLGIFGIFLNRKNVIIILMSVELMLLAVNINLVAFSAYAGDLVGQIFALFILTVAAAEAAIGLAILVVFFRNRGSIAVEDVNLMKGGRYYVCRNCLLATCRGAFSRVFWQNHWRSGSSLSYLYFYGGFYVARWNMLLRCGSATKCSDYSTIYLDRVW